MASVPGWSEGRIWPSGEYAAAAAWRSSPGTKLIWNMAKPKVAPVSRASSPTISSRLRLEDVGGLEEDRLALRRKALRPLGERGGRRLDCAGRILPPAGRHERDDVAGEGVAILERAAPGGVGPGPADVLLGLAYIGLDARHVVSSRRADPASKRCDALSTCQGSVGSLLPACQDTVP